MFPCLSGSGSDERERPASVYNRPSVIRHPVPTTASVHLGVAEGREGPMSGLTAAAAVAQAAAAPGPSLESAPLRCGESPERLPTCSRVPPAGAGCAPPPTALPPPSSLLSLHGGSSSSPSSSCGSLLRGNGGGCSGGCSPLGVGGL